MQQGPDTLSDQGGGGAGEDLVCLNVGGTRFLTTVSTLTMEVVGGVGTTTTTRSTGDVMNTPSTSSTSTTTGSGAAAGGSPLVQSPGNFFTGIVANALHHRPSTTAARAAAATGPLECFLDRCPHRFAVILHYLRYGEFRFVAPHIGDSFAKDVFDEMEYYGLEVPVTGQTLHWHWGKQCDKRCASLVAAYLKPQLYREEQPLTLEAAAKKVLLGLFSPARLVSLPVLRHPDVDAAPSPMLELRLAPCLDTMLSRIKNPAPMPNFKYNMGLQVRDAMQDDDSYGAFFAAFAAAQQERSVLSTALQSTPLPCYPAHPSSVGSWSSSSTQQQGAALHHHRDFTSLLNVFLNSTLQLLGHAERDWCVSCGLMAVDVENGAGFPGNDGRSEGRTFFPMFQFLLLPCQPSKNQAVEGDPGY